jgi:hypothetical protein
MVEPAESETLILMENVTKSRSQELLAARGAYIFSCAGAAKKPTRP